jgi:hypothetical protein
MNQSKSSMLLEHCRKTLRLGTLGREHAQLASLGQADRGDCPTSLSRVAEHETQDRQARAAERRGKAVGFLVVKTLVTLDFAAQPPTHPELLREPWEARAFRLDSAERLRRVHVAHRDVAAYGALVVPGGVR